MKARSLGAVLLLVTLLFSGCASGSDLDVKSSVTSDIFSSLASQSGMTTVDITEQFEEYDYIQSVVVALPADESYQIEFYTLSDASLAESFFETNRQYFEESKDESSVETSNSGDNYSGYALVADGRYMVVGRIDNTVIYADVDEVQSESAAAFIAALGY